MYPLLIVRVEIVCLILLVFLGINARFYKMGKDNDNFMRMLFFAIGHVVFDIITVLTVNNLDRVPNWANYIAHVIFYLFAILFAHEFFCYVIDLAYSEKRIQKVVRITGFSLIGLYLLLLPVMPIVYLQGNGTNYSLGPAAVVGYGLGMIFLVGSAVILTVNFKKLAPHVRMALSPMLTLMVVAECIQIAVPELLITGGAVTIVTVAFFFSLENPADVFRQKLLIDALTGVKSRNSYEFEIQQMEEKFVQNRDIRFGMVFCDINDLKEVNDEFGHLKGDDYIGDIAQILTRDLRGAKSIYRMGGDEFLAIYRNTDEAQIQQEIDQVNADCKAMSEKVPYRMGIAIGYAVSGEEYASLRSVLQMADYRMYQNKADMKRENDRLAQDGQLNVTGLTDRIFDAFAATGDRNYLTMGNLTTNVSRWSKAAVDYFGLPGEFIYDSGSVWMEYIHPDDRAAYWADISAVFGGEKKEHDIEYRVRNKRGEYVVCTCRGRIMKGKNGEPDLFVATLVNHGIGETIDPITGLHNERVLVPYMEKMFREKTRASFLTVKICSFSRINLLYGYLNGNQILGQFSGILRRIVGQKGRIFRIGDTRFTICLPEMDAEDVSKLYTDLTNAARFEITMDSITIPLKLAGGAFTVDEKYTGSVATVRNNLTSVLERSEQEGHGRLTFYSDPARGESQVDFKLLTAIYQDAVTERKGFRLEYQPIHRMDTGEVIGAEALLRWRSEEFSKVHPGQFVPWLENDPCFFQVGLWILRKALSDAREMLSVVPDFVINVNITVMQLEDEQFSSMVLEVLRETGFPPQQLCLELTERCRELDEEYLKSQIEFFHRFGIRIALDDVGTGFSSLSVLLNLPIDEIKMDKSFITDIRSREANQAYVSAIVDATRRLGLHSCLEGIEDRETYEYLRSFGATCCQGYYFSKSLPARDMKAYLLEEKEKGKVSV